jgi:HK97 family phage major capsid protein
MLELKTDPLEASFEALEREDEEIAQLKEEMAQLKARVDSQAVAAARPALSGAKAAESSAFVEKYLRKGLEAGVELKAVSGLSDGAGGYAVPEEIDAAIDRTLTAISPIRAIANVVKVASSTHGCDRRGREDRLGGGDRVSGASAREELISSGAPRGRSGTIP